WRRSPVSAASSTERWACPNFISWALGLGSSARCQYLDKRCASIIGPRAPIAWLNGYNHAVVSVLFISGWPFSACLSRLNPIAAARRPWYNEQSDRATSAAFEMTDLQ